MQKGLLLRKMCIRDRAGMQRQYTKMQAPEKGGQMARPQKCRCICSKPKVTEFSAQGASEQNCVNLTLDEYEVMRLLDFVNLNQEQCKIYTCLLYTSSAFRTALPLRSADLIWI